MPHPAGRKEAGKAKVLSGAGRGFRVRGYGGAGVDSLANEAGVTSGAFYAHFKSKAEAFRAAVGAGLEDLRRGITDFRGRYGNRWRERFVDFYLTDRRTCELGDSCALQSLSADVARADVDTHVLFEEHFRDILRTVSDGLDGRPKARQEQAIALLSLLAGAVTLARAVHDPKLSEEIASAVRKAATQLGTQQP
jgi:TetR/AcrR family transcriptional regulator, transcriptional repressor for nem operon